MRMSPCVRVILFVRVYESVKLCESLKLRVCVYVSSVCVYTSESVCVCWE